MSLGLFFWILVILWFVLGVYQSWPAATSGARSFWPLGGNLLLFLLIIILGIASFGWPIKG